MLLWIPAVLYMAAIFVLSSFSDLGPSPAGVSDKSWHMLAYAGLGVLLLLPLVEAKLSRVTWRRALAAIALATLYGVSDEVHQSFVPGRSPEALDVAADAMGAILGVACVGLLAAARAWGILRSWSHAPEGGDSRRTFNGDTPP